MSTLNEFSERLAVLYVQRRQKQIELSHLEQDLAGRQLVMTPAEGWPGKNEEQWGTARDKTFAGDETCQKIRAAMSKLRDDLALLEGEVEAQEVVFKAARWQIRADTNRLLARRGMDKETDDAESDDQSGAATVVQDEAAYAAAIGAEDDDQNPFD